MPLLIQYLLGPNLGWKDVALAVLDVAIVAYVFFRVLLLIRGTRAVQVLVGLMVLGIAYLVARWAGLEMLEWLLGHFLAYSFIFGVIVLFQADIRRALAQLGGTPVLDMIMGRGRDAQAATVDAVARAAGTLAAKRTGALIVLERLASLDDVAASGVKLDAAPTADLLLALFHPGAPMHDGAVVVQNGRISAARCVLPLSQSPDANDLGTRHRAALGLAEELDAAVVVVSEERGEISLAIGGGIHRNLDDERLRRFLTRLFPGRSRFGRAEREVDERRAVAKEKEAVS